MSWRWNGNLGDDMIWAAQQAMLGDVLALDQWLPEPKAVLIGGGTWIPKTPAHPDLLELSRRLPTAVFATGVDDPRFWGREAIPIWSEILGNARFVGVRGPQSIRWLDEMGIGTSGVSWIGDAALFFAERVPVTHPTGALAFNIGTTFDRLYGDDEDAVVEASIQAVRRLHADGWAISLVCAWSPDEEVLGRVRTAVPIRSVHHWHDDWQLALDEIDRFDIVIAEKLHVAIAAACRSVPFVSLAYRSKVDDFAESIGWEDFSVSTDGLDAAAIVALATELGGGLPGYRRLLGAGVEAARSRLLGAVPLALEALTA